MLFKLYLFVLIFTSSVCVGQNITLGIKKILINNNNELLLNCVVYNRDTTDIRLYKFQESDFCDGLDYLGIKKCLSKKEGRYFPCEGTKQLDNVVLDNDNTIELKENGHYEFIVKVKRNNLSINLLKNKSYEFQLVLNYNNLISDSNIIFFKHRLLSNKIVYCNSTIQ